MSLRSLSVPVNSPVRPIAPLYLLPDYSAFEGETYKKTPDAMQWVRHIDGWRSCHLELFTIIRAAGNRPISMTYIAQRYNTDTRRVERLIKEMHTAGWITIERHTGTTGRDLANAYDFTPLIDQLQQIAATMKAHSQTTRHNALTAVPPVRDAPLPPVRDTGPIEKVLTYLDNDIGSSVPPTPVAQPEAPPDAPAFDATYHALIEPLARVGDELDDQAHPLATVSRAYNLMMTVGLDVQTFLGLIDDARLLTHTAIQSQQRSKPPKVIANPMGYYFGVLARLTQPETQRPRWRTPPPCHQTAPPPANVWEEITAEATLEMTADNIARWFVPARQVAHDQAAALLTVAVPDAFHHQWLDERLRHKINALASRIEPGLQVSFVVQQLSMSTPIDGDR